MLRTRVFGCVCTCPLWTNSDFEALFSERLKVPMSRLTFPMGVAACAAGIFHTSREVNQWLLLQMAVPCLKLACNACTSG